MQFEGGTYSFLPLTVWHVWAPAKCKFLWLMLQDRIWTADRLQQREWPNEYFCQFCFRNLETSFHLFCECPAVRSIWNQVSTWTGISTFNPSEWNNYSTVQDWFRSLTTESTSSTAKRVRSLAILIICHIWKERNDRVIQPGEKPIQRLIAEIKDEAKIWCQAGAKRLRPLVVIETSE